MSGYDDDDDDHIDHDDDSNHNEHGKFDTVIFFMFLL